MSQAIKAVAGLDPRTGFAHSCVLTTAQLRRNRLLTVGAVLLQAPIAMMLSQPQWLLHSYLQFPALYLYGLLCATIGVLGEESYLSERAARACLEAELDGFAKPTEGGAK